MNRLLLSLAAVAASAGFASAQEYTTFRVCEDQHVLRTSDGADAGHVEYIVVDPGEHRVVSTIVTGGVLADRTVVVPIDSFRYGSGREVTLTTIDRERLVSAPVIERNQITTIREGRFEPALIERSRTYFHGGADVSRSTTRTEVEGRDRSRTNVDVNSRTNVDVNARGADGARMRDRANATNENNPPAGTDRSTTRGQRPGANNADHATTDAAGTAGRTTTKGKAKNGRPGDAATDPSTRGTTKTGDAATSTAEQPGTTRGDAERPGSSTKSGGHSGSSKAGAGDASTSPSGADRAGSSTRSKAGGESSSESNPAGARSSGKAGGAAATEHSNAGGASAEHSKAGAAERSSAGGASAEHGKAGGSAGEHGSGKGGKAGGPEGGARSESGGASKTNQ